MENLNREDRYFRAKERVKALKDFYASLLAYCIVIPFLIWLNLRTTSFPWAVFPALGWGVGLICQALEVYGRNPLWGKRWEERKIREFMNQENF